MAETFKIWVVAIKGGVNHIIRQIGIFRRFVGVADVRSWEFSYGRCYAFRVGRNTVRYWSGDGRPDLANRNPGKVVSVLHFSSPWLIRRVYHAERMVQEERIPDYNGVNYG